MSEQVSDILKYIKNSIGYLNIKKYSYKYETNFQVGSSDTLDTDIGIASVPSTLLQHVSGGSDLLIHKLPNLDP